MNVRNYIKIGIALLVNIFVFNANVAQGQDEVFAVALETYTVSQEVEYSKEQKRQLHCMAENIYYEAGKESLNGKIAVAQVVMNRVESGRFPEDPCKVIHQKTKTANSTVCQFSWFCSKSLRSRPKNLTQWTESFAVAKDVLFSGTRLPNLSHAIYFHASSVYPNWKNTQKVAKIGNHIFYKEKTRYKI